MLSPNERADQEKADRLKADVRADQEKADRLKADVRADQEKADRLKAEDKINKILAFIKSQGLESNIPKDLLEG